MGRHSVALAFSQQCKEHYIKAFVFGISESATFAYLLNDKMHKMLLTLHVYKNGMNKLAYWQSVQSPCPS